MAHKAYATGVPIQISIYPDHIVFWNPGELPEQLSIEKLLQKHPSYPYNPDIANALFRSGDIEMWGRGYRKIVKSVLEQKLLPPQIEYVNGLMLTYYSDAHTQLKMESVDEKVAQIIEYVIARESINNTEVQKLLSVSKPTATRLLKQTEFWLKMQGVHGKGTRYELKWRAL